MPGAYFKDTTSQPSQVFTPSTQVMMLLRRDLFHFPRKGGFGYMVVGEAGGVGFWPYTLHSQKQLAQWAIELTAEFDACW